MSLLRIQRTVRIDLVGAFLLLLLSLQTLSSRAWQNAGMITLIHALLPVSEFSTHQALVRAENWLRQAMDWDGNNSSAHQGLGFVHWYRGEDKLAFDEWQQAGFEADDFIAFGKQYGNSLEALRWYELAERLEPSNQRLWLEVGQACQLNPAASDICRRFLDYNNGNRLVDPAFTFGRQAWHFNRRQGGVNQIDECPAFPEKQCAILKIENVVPERGVSWHQCMKVQPGQEYTFSAWIKIEDFGGVRWRPLYYQGDIDGKPRGRSAGNRSGEAGWHYEEYSFAVPEFDENHACFHPVRLEGRGQAWFYGATLVER